MLQRVWAEVGKGLDVCRATKDGQIEHFRSKKKNETSRVSLSVCRSHVTAIQGYRINDMCQGVMNCPVHIYNYRMFSS